MMWYQQKDITEVTTGIIVHGVNCQGVMGSGVAKAIRAKWPKVYESYRTTWDMAFKGADLLGTIDTVPLGEITVVNAFTQEFYGSDSKKYVSYDAVDGCFRALAYWMKENDSDDIIYIPKIGSGLGGGRWEVIREIILSHFDVKQDIICCLV